MERSLGCTVRSRSALSRATRRLALGSVAAGVAALLTARLVTAAASAELSLNPSSGAPGDAVVATGSGFCPPPCTAVEIDFGGVNVATGVVVAADGSLAAVTFKVPGGTDAGPDNVVAIQRTAQGQTMYTFASFTLAANTPAPGTTTTPAISDSGGPGGTSAPPRRGSSPVTGSPGTGTRGSGSPASDNGASTTPGGRTVPGGGSGAAGALSVIVGAAAAAMLLVALAGAVVMRRRT